MGSRNIAALFKHREYRVTFWTHINILGFIEHTHTHTQNEVSTNFFSNPFDGINSIFKTGQIRVI